MLGRHQLGRDACGHRAEAARSARRQPRARLQLRYRRALSLGAGLPAGVSRWSVWTIRMAIRRSRGGCAALPVPCAWRSPCATDYHERERADGTARRDAGAMRASSALIADFYGQPGARFRRIRRELAGALRRLGRRLSRAAARRARRAHRPAGKREGSKAAAVGYCVGGQAALGSGARWGGHRARRQLPRPPRYRRPARARRRSRRASSSATAMPIRLHRAIRCSNSQENWTRPKPAGTSTAMGVKRGYSQSRSDVHKLPAMSYNASADRQAQLRS